MTSNKSTSKLTSKIFLALKAMIFVAGAVTLQACFFGGHPAYGPDPYAYGSGPGYAYGGSPAYVYGRPPVVGDYDDHHAWHERDWWVRNNHPWVRQHHPEWIAHEHGHESDHANR
jgi:hypothetical protein